MEYEYENLETGECEILEIDYTISPIINETRYQPSEGGECEFTATNESGQNVTNELSYKVCAEIEELCHTDNAKYQD